MKLSEVIDKAFADLDQPSRDRIYKEFFNEVNNIVDESVERRVYRKDPVRRVLTFIWGLLELFIAYSGALGMVELIKNHPSHQIWIFCAGSAVLGTVVFFGILTIEKSLK